MKQTGQSIADILGEEQIEKITLSEYPTGYAIEVTEGGQVSSPVIALRPGVDVTAHDPDELRARLTITDPELLDDWYQPGCDDQPECDDLLLIFRFFMHTLNCGRHLSMSRYQTDSGDREPVES